MKVSQVAVLRKQGPVFTNSGQASEQWRNRGRVQSHHTFAKFWYIYKKDRVNPMLFFSNSGTEWPGPSEEKAQQQARPSFLHTSKFSSSLHSKPSGLPLLSGLSQVPNAGFSPSPADWNKVSLKHHFSNAPNPNIQVAFLHHLKHGRWLHAFSVMATQPWNIFPRESCLAQTIDFPPSCKNVENNASECYVVCYWLFAIVICFSDPFSMLLIAFISSYCMLLMTDRLDKNLK